MWVITARSCTRSGSSAAEVTTLRARFQLLRVNTITAGDGVMSGLSLRAVIVTLALGCALSATL